jgi:competence ComEA-like helix-hairpin-helix protein
MKRLIFLLLILLVPLIIADCDDEQININSASAEELEEIIWVGPATAEKIIAGREFDSIDSLIDVSGIGDIKLQAIKEQGLACVEDEEPEDRIIIPSPTPKEKIILEPEVIKLGYESQKDIKTEKNNSNKSKYAIYGLWFFSILIVSLLILKKNRFNKNEFS